MKKLKKKLKKKKNYEIFHRRKIISLTIIIIFHA